MLGRYKAADQAVQNFLLNQGRKIDNLSAGVKDAKTERVIANLAPIQNKDPKVALQDLATGMASKRSLNPVYQFSEEGVGVAEALQNKIKVGDARSIRDNLGDVASARGRVLDPAANLLGLLGGRKPGTDFVAADRISNAGRYGQAARAGVAGVAGGSALTAAGSGLIDLMAYIQSSNEQISERADQLA